MTPNASRLLRTVDDMLLDAGQSHASELRAALLSLGSFGSLPAPAPSAELRALMASSQDQLTRRRWLPRHRPTAVGLAVIAGMGLGVSGVAATAPVHGQPAGTSIQHMLQGWAPSWTIAGGPSASAAGSLPGPQPATPSPAAEPRPAPLAPKQPKTPGGSGAKAGGPATEADPVTGDGGAAAKDSLPGAHRAAGAAPATDAAQPVKFQEGAARESERAADHVAREFERVQELLTGSLGENIAAGEAPSSAVPVPALTAKTGAGKNAILGAKWLKKFSR